MSSTHIETTQKPFDAMAALRQAREAVDAAKAQLQATPGDGVQVICAADLVPQPVHWLWRGWLAQGKLHILAGMPGEGKTTIAMSFAATLTSGGQWPDGTWCDPGNALIWSGEDDLADTLLPRLMAAGAERSRCYFINGMQVDGQKRAFDPAHDMAEVEALARRIGDVRLLVIDPLVSAVTGDSHKNTEVRRALQPMVDLGQRLGAVVLGISHLSKPGSGGNGNPLTRLSGSIAFGALARVVLLTGPARNPAQGALPAFAGPDGLASSAPATRVVTRAKSNIGPDGGGFQYHVDKLSPLPGIETNQIVWGQEAHGSASELLADPEASTDDKRMVSALDEACDFLRQTLADDVVPANTVKAQAERAGVALATLRRAAFSVGVIKAKSGSGTWYWKLAKLPGKGDQLPVP